MGAGVLSVVLAVGTVVGTVVLLCSPLMMATDRVIEVSVCFQWIEGMSLCYHVIGKASGGSGAGVSGAWVRIV